MVLSVWNALKLEMTEEVEVRGDCGRCVWGYSLDRGRCYCHDAT